MQEITIVLKFRSDGLIPMDLLEQLSGIVEAQVEALSDGNVSDDYPVSDVRTEITQTPGPQD